MTSWYSPGMTTAKIAISLPDELLRLVDQERGAKALSRSEFIRAALVDSFARAEERQAALEYVRAYGDQPETEDEIEAALKSATALLATEPWE